MTETSSNLSRDVELAERTVWSVLRDGDIDADQAALAQDFLGVYPDGFADRADHAGQLRDGPTIASYDLHDIRVRALGQEHALIAYRAVYTRPTRTAPEEMYVSSIWRREDSGWVNIFSQDTPANPTTKLP
ncbi:MAG: nuclear transport factor 2 family protein [Pseudomonadota bacterium]